VERLVYAVLFLLLAVQIPMAVFVYVDARRRGIDRNTRDQYELGILVPSLGFLVFVHYLASRDGLPPSE